MKPRTRALVLSSLAAALAIWACSFPDVQFVSGDSTEDGGNDVATPDTGTDVGAGGDAALPPDVDPNGKDSGTAPKVDGGGIVEAGPDGEGCIKGRCDCDGDDFSNGGPGCSDAGPLDCDDMNKLVYPGAERDFRIETEWPSTHTPSFDWNCDGQSKKHYSYGVNCGGLLSNCNVEGFSDNPACGIEGSYVTCKPGLALPGLPLTCVVNTTEKRIQGCR